MSNYKRQPRSLCLTGLANACLAKICVCFAATVLVAWTLPGVASAGAIAFRANSADAAEIVMKIRRRGHIEKDGSAKSGTAKSGTAKSGTATDKFSAARQALESIARNRARQDYWSYYADCDRWQVNLTASRCPATDSQPQSRKPSFSPTFIELDRSSQIVGVEILNCGVISQTVNKNSAGDSCSVDHVVDAASIHVKKPSSAVHRKQVNEGSSQVLAKSIVCYWTARHLPVLYRLSNRLSNHDWASVVQSMRQLQFAAIESDSFGFGSSGSAPASVVAEMLEKNSLH